jgi:hypothetical protein
LEVFGERRGLLEALVASCATLAAAGISLAGARSLGYPAWLRCLDAGDEPAC